MSQETVNKQGLLYEGKAKKIYTTSDEQLLWVEYKDDATAFNGEKKGTIQGKGRFNNLISAALFTHLTQAGVANHFERLLSEHEQLVRKVRIVPVEVVVRNLAAGSMAKRLGLEEGWELPRPVLEFYYKDDQLGDPLIIEDHIDVLGLASPEQVEQMKTVALKVNQLLSRYFAGRDIILVDFKLEFGLTDDGQLLLADEISPDTCRLWDRHTRDKLDKDRFRRDLGGVEEAYQEILKRVGGEAHV
ncbi:phosphoribosylaminoimidazole-succinocarboxamide synthase [Caldalkalibacillus uzonensis]|uniref:Phosphoribosylaminoimidazole-succinocarboxamide synthase n=1 Tax=Caldalkalibacillus uzonensis TaxID=353224 RepID=A0ABU0CUN9_9BACI|nr:phosphoribosylaminoimidazolesuccinocarboxamide synthase [Caldalkalibacillus uzonensis]MDQ0340134.1 phosphoribosylaminoimidazole-succinocarboxamide synthase [Caldalkalibacillus uzonensis]